MDPQDFLIMSLVFNIIFLVSLSGSESLLKSISTACFPISYPGCRTAVSGGFKEIDQYISSKPAIAISAAFALSITTRSAST